MLPRNDQVELFKPLQYEIHFGEVNVAQLNLNRPIYKSE
jgi:hypothetical protein